MSRLWFIQRLRNLATAGLASLLITGSLAAQAATCPFRVVTTDLPDGTTNGEYYAVLLTTCAAGPVTYEMAPSTNEPLPNGLVLDELSGAISGYPTTVDASVKNTFRISDGTTTLDVPITWKISASGGGGNSGAALGAITLPEGRVGADYSYTLTSVGGDGSFVFGAQNLPSGVTLDGLTGEISGNPIVAGTYFVTFTLNDLDDIGESNKIVSTVPMVIYPADPTPEDLDNYNFKFDTEIISNTEVGADYSTTITTSDAEGIVTYSATSLPDGLTLDQATGVISGIPTTAGTFYLSLSATDADTGATISTNLVMWIMANGTSTFYWDFFGIPAGLYGMNYDRQPPILIKANNGTAVTYSATGLPPGINYDPSTGEISGTPSETGIFPVTFTATDTGPAPDEVLTLEYEFIVLPPSGGDVSRLAVNLWIKSLQAKVNTDPTTVPNDSLKATYYYNQDRRTGNIYNPATDDFYFKLGSFERTIPAGTMVSGSLGAFSYTSPSEDITKVVIKGSPTKQSLTVSVAGTELGTTMPAEMLENSVIIGKKGYKHDVYLDINGKFLPTSGYRSTAFIASKGTVKATGTIKDALKLSLYLGDPSFQMLPGDTVKLRLYDGPTMLLDKNLTDLVTVTAAYDKQGHLVYTMANSKETPDTATIDILKSFKYSSGKGLMSISLAALDPTWTSALAAEQAHVGVEIIIGSTSYFTSVTLFESGTDSNSYSTTISKAFPPVFPLLK